MQKDSAQIKGIVNLVLRDNAGRVKQHKTIRNMVTNYGLAHIVGRLIDPKQDIRGSHVIPRMMSHMAIGSGQADASRGGTVGAYTTTSATDRALEFEEGIRVQVKRDTSFNAEYASFTVDFADTLPNPYLRASGTTLTIAPTTNTGSAAYNARYIRAPGGNIGDAIMTVTDTTSGGTKAFPDGTKILAKNINSDGLLEFTLDSTIDTANSAFGTAGTPVTLTFTPIQSQVGRLNPSTGVVESTVSWSGAGDVTGVNSADLGGSGNIPSRGIIGGYYNQGDAGINGTSDPVPPFFGDADDVPVDIANGDPFVQFGTSVDGVFQGTVAGSSVVIDQGVDPEGYPTTENDYGSQPSPVDTSDPANTSPPNAVAGTKKTGTRIVYVATFKEQNPAPVGNVFTGGGTECPIVEAGIFNALAPDVDTNTNADLTSFDPPLLPSGGTGTAQTNTLGGSIVTLNAPGATKGAISQTMLCRTVFNVVNKASDDTLQITWSVQLKDTP